ncbi:MAG TPA: LemA family protein [Paenalcaligenes sp.]|nr:LemA family protein [Paenalcaligenes sp.]
MNMHFRWLWLLLFSLFLTSCGYNEIQRLDEQVKSAWSQTLNQYERRADLVPKLVNSVDAFMTHEKEVLTEVTEARSRVGQIRISADDLDNPALMERFAEAQGQLGSALSRLLAVAENYPQLKSDSLFLDLLTQLEGTENRIATERGRYIQAVQNYNVFIRQFPNVITAKVLGYPILENYGVDREDALRRDPEVRFGNSR